jgi:hypothetical protein
MRKFLAVILSVAGVAFTEAAFTEARVQPQQSDRDVRLVLLVAVDQFRYDYLTRFRTELTGGLKKLLTDGAVFTNAYLEHYPTVTAIGHATMLSGATPSVSGIIGNDWFDRESGASVASVTDTAVKPVGSPAAATASPRRLLVSTLGDEMKLAAGGPRTAPAAPRVIGISLKDRAAIMPVGRGADAAYWFDTKTGCFVTSTYYMNELPAWVRTFNDRHLSDSFAGQSWQPLLSAPVVLRQLPKETGATLNEAVYGTPFGGEMLLDFVSEALTQERLGQHKATDLLTVSFSSTDAVGHTYGPDSPQLKDIVLRTDREIGRLLERVDAAVGLQHTIVALTSDHGVAPVPETLAERSLPGGRMTSKELFGPIEQALARFGEGQWISGTAGSSPYLNYKLIDQLKLDPTEIRRAAAAAAVAIPHVARVYTRDQLLRGEAVDDLIGRRVLRGFNAQRSGDLEIILEPYWIRQATGTTHGSPYNYDAHIPLMLMGRRIRAGSYPEHVALNDLAPTLATLIEVDAPSGSSGRVLTEAFTDSLNSSRRP